MKNNISYWCCGNSKCGKPFKISSMVCKHIKKSHQTKPFCPYCQKQLTNKASKEYYDNYYLKKDIERDKAIIKAKGKWYHGGLK